MPKGWMICAMFLLTLTVMFPLLSAAPLDPRVDTNAKDDLKNGQEGNVPEHDQRDSKLSFDLSEMVWNSIDISGSVTIQEGSVGHKLEIDVNQHSHEHSKDGGHHHRDDMVPVDCQWSKYSDWSSCSALCGDGTRQRERSIATPAKDGGKPCVGGEVEKEPCNQGTCTGEVCSAGEINSASCFCKSATGDGSGEVCAAKQGCTEEGTCYDVCKPGPYKLQADCFCQEKTTRRGKLCIEGSKCEEGGCLKNERIQRIQESCSFDDNLLTPSPTFGGQMSPHDTRALFKWKNNLIPYYYNDGKTYDGKTYQASDGDKDLVRSVMNKIEEKTCFKFEEKKKEEYEDKHVLEIVIMDVRCGSATGQVKKVAYKPKITRLYLSAHITYSNGDDCGYKGLLIHELMHVLGVGHTQRRKDRVNFIEVRFENIDKAMESQFQICNSCKLYDEIPYDCGSIMHYGTHMNGKEVIVPKENCKLDNFPLSDYVTDAPEKDYDLLKIIGNCAGLVCAAGEINSDSCFCKSRNDDKSGEVCSSNQGCTEEGACYAVCTPGPHILQEDCFCNEADGGGKLCKEGFKCDGGECGNIDIEDDNKIDDNLLVPKDMITPDEMLQWENNVVPYYYRDESASVADKDLVRSIMDRFEKETCFKFVEKNIEEYKNNGLQSLEIVIRDVSHSAGVVGEVRKGNNRLKVELTFSAHLTDENGDDCGYKGVVTHELMHVLGVINTHQRRDRDDFITVKFENLGDNKNLRKNFEKCETCTLYDEYDCGSIMHWGTHVNGKEVIVPKENCELDEFPLVNFVRDATEKDYELLNIIGKCAAQSTMAASTTVATTAASTTVATTAASTTVATTVASTTASTTAASTVASSTGAPPDDSLGYECNCSPNDGKPFTCSSLRPTSPNQCSDHDHCPSQPVCKLKIEGDNHLRHATSNALDKCVDLCQSNSCQNDRNILQGCNQMFSCAHGCKIRQLGIDRETCRSHCDRHAESGCGPEINDWKFELCHGCNRAGCNHHKKEECEQGCEFFEDTSGGQSVGA